MTKLYLLSKSVHRYLVIIISVLTILMAGTGVMLKFLFIAAKLGLDIGMIRYVHNQLSIVFTIALVFMMLSGVIMYVFPLLRKKDSPPKMPPVTEPQNN